MASWHETSQTSRPWNRGDVVYGLVTILGYVACILLLAFPPSW